MPTFSRLASSNAQLPKGPQAIQSSQDSRVDECCHGAHRAYRRSLHSSNRPTKEFSFQSIDPPALAGDEFGRVLEDLSQRQRPQLIRLCRTTPTSFPLHCGIGKFKDCQIPSYASLREGPDWWIVTSTINWNYYTNFLASALSHSAQLAKNVLHHVLHDLVYEYNPETSLRVITEMDLFRILLFPVEHGGNRDPTVSDRTHIPDWMAAISPLATNNNPPMDCSGASPTDVPMIVYNSNHPVETNLRQLSTQLQQILAQSVENKVNSPISLDAGIYSAISGGRFVGPSIQTPRLASNADDIQRLIGVSAILNHQNAMIVIRKSSCSLYRKEMKDNEETRLQFCASDSTLIEIVNVKENTIVKDIYNAHLINNKYGFKTSFLASEALRCQQANQKTGHPQEPKKRRR
ncbi:hypothetical protein KEM48_014449 [Puccinia striiformis f. sp. tritici PST-130]|nr:hypothetical protein KEM48_014449 [Puccinia striiformis f. sp. tritici PST-130]